MDNNSSSSELLECPICCELFNNATETFCGHAFCEYCIARCLEHEPDVCPVCRNDPSPIHPSFTIRRIVEEWRNMKGIALDETEKLSPSEEKQAGNNHYLKGEYADAIKHYTNATEDAPSAILFGNRATAFFKLNQWKLALYDCDKAIKMDPTYVKAYLRKGLCLEQMKDYAQAYKTFNEVKQLDKAGTLKEETEQAIKRVYQMAAIQSASSAQSAQPRANPAPPVHPPQPPYPQNIHPPAQGYPGNQYPAYPQPNYRNSTGIPPQNTYRHYEPYSAAPRNVAYPGANTSPSRGGRRESRGECSIQ